MASGSKSSAARPVLEANKLRVGYGQSSVCGPVTTSLRGGQVLAVVGFNGAGKSTAVRTMVGKQAAISGTALLDGVEVDDRMVSYRKKVAAVFDEDAFFSSLTVAEHLTLVARGHGVPDDVTAVATELEFFGLKDHANVLPHSLSSGQRRRMLLASAFIRPFRLLVLDEPEQRLDVLIRDRLAERIARCAQAGAAVLLVTHDVELLMQAAGRSLFIDEEVREMSPTDSAARISTH